MTSPANYPLHIKQYGRAREVHYAAETATGVQTRCGFSQPKGKFTVTDEPVTCLSCKPPTRG